MKPLKMKALAVMAITMGVGMGVQGAAQASVMADAILRLSNFKFTDSAGNVITVGKDITNLVGSNNANADAAIDAASENDRRNVGLGASLDLAQQCEGACPAGTGNNDFRAYETIYGAVPPSTEVAFSDTNLTGSSVAGLGAPVGANADTRATGALLTGQVGDANSNIGLLVSFNFTAASSTTFGFSTDYNLTSRAFVSSDETVGSNAQATVSWVITLTNHSAGDTLIGQASPTQLQQTFAALNPGENTGVKNATGSIGFTSLTGGTNLVAGDIYTLNLRHTTQIDVARVAGPPTVPEPATIALLGIGLLGVAGSRQRLRKSAQ